MRHIWTGFFKTSLALAFSVASLGVLGIAPVAADAAPTFLMIDNNARGVSPALPGDDESIKDTTKRKLLKVFVDDFGRELIIDTGSVGKETWFAPEAILPAWITAGPTADGLQNLWRAAASAHTADQKVYDTLKNQKFDVTPLGIELADLVGRTVCALIADVHVEQGGLQAKLGGDTQLIAFDVLAVTPLDVVAAG